MTGVALSPNFVFLRQHEPQLVRLGTWAERYFKDDPCTCLIKLRQFGELLAQMAAANAGLYLNDQESQVDLLRRLRDRGVVIGEVYQLFQELRVKGNTATHDMVGDHRTALSNLKYARSLGIWFHRSFGGDRNFKAGPFVPPPDPVQETEALRQELERLRSEAEQHRSQAQVAQATAAEEAELRQLAESLLEAAEAEAEAARQRLEALQAEAKQQPARVIQETIAQAQQAEQTIDLDETETRRLIDAQLRDAEWEADTTELTFNKGTRPQKGKNLAIAEWPTTNGKADYALFVGLQAVAVVEAKRQSKDVYSDIDQAKRYSRGYKIKGNETLPGGPWGEYRVPFVFATNGRKFLEQLRTKSGIWFCDLRTNQPRRPLPTWYTPEGLVALLGQDLEAAHDQLRQEGFNYNLKLRDYQIEAIKAAEAALEKGQRELLLAMATGTGKTKTSIVMVYRLLKSKRFRRILFLVDRRALGEQTANAFKDSRMEDLQTFCDIFDVKELGDAAPETDTKVQIATVQSFVKRLFYTEDEAAAPKADQYDCIIVDECHRGYLLDRELSEAELTFRDFNDYISKYRRVLDHFDAVKVGLTATPALHTTQIFGEPVYQYSYRQAVIDGHLIDHEPPIQIRTRLSEEGIQWQAGAQVSVFDPKTGEIDLVHTPDELNFEVEHFNRQVITESFNRVVCEQLAQDIDPYLPGKTLIFCVTDQHADMVVDLLKEAYGEIDDDAIAKITGRSDQPLQLIRRFRNEVYPKIAVTVDLLTTGIDVPSICNLVFLRRVNSRILYEQMLGRATRLCDDLGDGVIKDVFRIFDAVRLYEAIQDFSTMKPVVPQPNISFEQLFTELGQLDEPDAVEQVVDQLLAKIQRKRKHLSDENREVIEQIAGMPVEDIPKHLKGQTPAEAAAWFQQRKELAQMLDRKDGGRRPLIISDHEDELLSVSRGYTAEQGGTYGQRPEDYLESFKAYVENNRNEIAALLVVTQRPRDLTRAQLKELKAKLDAAGYSEKALQVAWQEMSNQDIAASIIGFIRQAALGDALMPYGQRVDRAIGKILANRQWTAPQRQWLERIGQQLKAETVVDRAALDQGQFKAQGGFKRINKLFNDQLEDILTEINAEIWQDAS
jgi:type I restriction enzyme, R subunit